MTIRLLWLAVVLTCAGLLGAALYLQISHYLLPCPLCVVQRMLYWAIALTAALAWLHHPHRHGQAVYAGLIGLWALGGAGVALHHLWVIRHPEDAGCSISPLENFLNNLPTARWWPQMFEANGDCADATWTFLNLTIPEWSLIAFGGFALLAAYVFFNARRAGADSA